MEYLTLIFGLALLVIGASYFVEYAVNLAKLLHLHVAIFGAVIVAIGTSLPELVVTLESAMKNSPDIIIGNILGSNIANVGLVLGTAILLGKAVPNQSKLNGKNTLLLVLSLIFLGLLQLKLLFWPVGLLLFALAVVLVLDMARNREQTADFSGINIKDKVMAWAVLVASLVGVIIGSQLVVNSSITIAQTLGISVGVIAATIIAVGTSLPELVITIMAVKKKEHGLAVGNIIGSNLFNLALIGGVGAILVNLNTIVTLPITIFFLVFLLFGYLLAGGIIKPRRWYGAVMVGLYVLFLVSEYVSV